MDMERMQRTMKKMCRKLTKEQREIFDTIFGDIPGFGNIPGADDADDEGEEKMSMEMTKSEAVSFLRKLGNCHFGTPITISNDDETMEGIFLKVDDNGYVRYMAYDDDSQTLCYGKCAPMLIKFKGE